MGSRQDITLLGNSDFDGFFRPTYLPRYLQPHPPRKNINVTMEDNIPYVRT